MNPTTATARSEAWHRWQRRWTALNILPVCLAVLFWGPTAVCVASAVLTVLVLGVRISGRSQSHRTTATALIRASGPLVAFCVSFTLGWALLFHLSASAAIVVALLAIVTSPPVVASYRRFVGAQGPTAVPDIRGGLPTPTPTATLTALLAEPARQMTDAQLCKAWRDSFEALQRVHTAREMMLIVALRQSFMDALDERHSPEFQAWLASNPLASAGPEGFLKSA